ncbi:MAG: 3-dehydroquinate synthase [Schwartzia sp.]|nr:3-dehydroquinate synthase [Schwartzia sp. (in: firmicutes)]
MGEVNVILPENSYQIDIGKNLDDKVRAYFKGAGFSSRALVVTDSNVGRLYENAVEALLRSAGLAAETYRIPPGERSKCLAEAEKIYTRAIANGLDRKSVICALGGGVVGDLAGFVAATYMRGIPYVQMPTSLLAQVDSSVGGKVAVNHPSGKNLIGAFYQPKRVFIDLAFLSTLPPREICTGLGEIVKYGAIYDEAFFAYLEKNGPAILALESQALEHIVTRSVEIKADVVRQDERENGLRRILNFGHTIGHAIEKETQYVRYNHGEAVAIGMAGAAFISRALGLIDDTIVDRLLHLMETLHLPIKAKGCTADAMYKDIFHDKKTVDGQVNWVLLDALGHVTVRRDVPEEIVRDAMARIIE